MAMARGFAFSKNTETLFICSSFRFVLFIIMIKCYSFGFAFPNLKYFCRFLTSSGGQMAEEKRARREIITVGFTFRVEELIPICETEAVRHNLPNYFFSNKVSCMHYTTDEYICIIYRHVLYLFVYTCI